MKNPFEDFGAKKQEQKEEHPEIPLFDKLLPGDKKFVLKIKQLSEMTEDEFLDQRGFSPEEKLKPWARDIENDEWVVTMWELVLLHLSELQDSLWQIELKQKGEIPVSAEIKLGPRTCYLINNIANRILLLDAKKLSLSMPDGDYGSNLWIRSNASSEDVNKRLKAIHELLNILHRYREVPAIFRLTKDFWRWSFGYRGIKGTIESIKSFLKNKDVTRKQEEFFGKLGNLGNNLIKGGGQS